MNVIRKVGSSRGIRRFALHPQVRKVGAGLLSTRFLVSAFETTTPLRFLTGEAFRRGRIETYRTKSGMPVALQHGHDAEALFELFVRGEYEPPTPLAARLGPEQVGEVLDIGANVGMFSAWAAARWPQAHITAFEPVPNNCRVYREWLSESGARAELVEAAASVRPDRLIFADHGAGSRGERVREGGALTVDAVADPSQAAVSEVEAVDVYPWLLRADFIKMDIEGGEWDILLDPRLAEVTAVIVMEYHRVGAPSLPARDAAMSLLGAAGFRTGHGSQNHWGHGTLWAWKER